MLAHLIGSSGKSVTVTASQNGNPVRRLLDTEVESSSLILYDPPSHTTEKPITQVG